MKVAVAYFGIPRNSSVCFPTIQENVYRQLAKGAQVASFYHLYEPQLVENPRSGESAFLDHKNYVVFSGMDGRFEAAGPCLERWGFDRIKQFGDVWGDDFKSLSNLIHQLNSLHAVTGLVQEYDPDVVLFLRPDLLYHDRLPQFVVSAVAAQPLAVYIPEWQWWNGLNDRFAICGRSVYAAYGRRIERAFSFCEQQSRGLHAERFLRFAMTEAGAKLRALEMRASRVRIGGEVVAESFSPKRSMGRRENRFALPLARLRARLDWLRYNERCAL